MFLASTFSTTTAQFGQTSSEFQQIFSSRRDIRYPRFQMVFNIAPSSVFWIKLVFYFFFHLFHSPSPQMILVKMQSAGVIFKIIQVYMTSRLFPSTAAFNFKKSSARCGSAQLQRLGKTLYIYSGDSVTSFSEGRENILIPHPMSHCGHTQLQLIQDGGQSFSIRYRLELWIGAWISSNGGILIVVEFGDFLSQNLSLWSHVSRTRLALSAQVVPGCGNKTIFCPALIGCFRREMTSPDHLDQIVAIFSQKSWETPVS